MGILGVFPGGTHFTEIIADIQELAN